MRFTGHNYLIGGIQMRVTSGWRAFILASGVVAAVWGIGCGSPPGQGVTSTLTAQSLTGNTSCDLLANSSLGRGVEFSEDTGFLDWVYAVTTFPESDLGRGKWVGVIERRALPVGQDSRVFPGLAQGEWGCLLIIRYTDPATNTLVSESFLQRVGSPYPVKLANSLVCDHQGTHPPGTKPEIKDEPEKCTVGSTVTLTATVGPGALATLRWPSTGAGMRADFEDAARKAGGLWAARAASLAAMIAQPGPWFPCTGSGCCRAF